MTIKEVMDKTTAFFKQKGFSSARLDTELLMAHGLRCERMQLYLKFDQPLGEPELETLRNLVKRRTAGEPVAYILGKKDFYKGSFLVNKSVLIPRPETETLVELAANYIEKKKPVTGFQVLDIGGGSGCIGISVAKEFPVVHVSIIEKSPEAVAVIKENIKLNQVNNVTVFNVDADDVESFREAWALELENAGSPNESTEIVGDAIKVPAHTLASQPFFDLIVSNPPYISKGDRDVEENVKKFEPEEALFADDEGFLFLKDWARKYSSFLKEDAQMIFEMGHLQGQRISEHLSKLNIFKSVTIKKDLSEKDRFISMYK